MPDAQPLRARRGRTADLAGRLAEEGVLRHYRARGATLLEARWRGRGGEIDLILREGADLVFVEVKAARDHDAAAQALGPAQMRRIMLSALDYCEARALGEVPMRFDVALVDATGRVALMPDAFGAG